LPKYNFLYSGNARTDALTICDYVDEYYSQLQAGEVFINIPVLIEVVNSSLNNFPHPSGCGDSSPFKKAAAFTTNFVAARPIVTPINSPQFTSGPLKDLSNHQNAIIAFDLCVDALHGAKLQREDKEVILANRISVSLHYWKDMITALSMCSTTNHFPCVSLMYEALAYQTNPDASYPKVT
jgi:hypothetical protein